MKNPYSLDNFKLYLSINFPNYILLDNEYINCNTKMKFICSNHIEKGVQMNTVANIINNHHICKYCSYDQMRNDRVLGKDILSKLCESKKVTYSGQYTKNHETVVKYFCKKHENNGIQEMSLTHFKQSVVPCRYCNISSGEFKISEFLNKHNIFYENEKIFDDCRDIKPLRFDFYLPKYNLVIEYDGKQHFEPVKFWNGNDAEEKYNKTKKT